MPKPKYRCLVLDHDDTAVQSEATVNYPFFCYILDRFRPGVRITLQEYIKGCFSPGFVDMCRQRYQFTEQELEDEFRGWQIYVREHTPPAFPGIDTVIHRQKALGGIICVVSHSCKENILRDYTTHFGIKPDAIYGWDLPEALRKPSTFPLEDIMARFHLAPKDLLVVDDMKPAYEMASAAGVDIAFAGWSRKDFPEISAEMTRLCNFTFYSPKELEKFLFD